MIENKNKNRTDKQHTEEKSRLQPYKPTYGKIETDKQPETKRQILWKQKLGNEPNLPRQKHNLLELRKQGHFNKVCKLKQVQFMIKLSDIEEETDQDNETHRPNKQYQ